MQQHTHFIILMLVAIIALCGCDKATESVSSLKKAVTESVAGSSTEPQADASSGDALDNAAENIADLQETMAGIIGGGREDAPGSTEAVFPRYQWKANRKGREQARVLSSSSATEDDMKNVAVNLVQQFGGRHWIVAFYSDVRSVEEWSSRTAADRKRDDYLGSVILDAGRPAKVRFHPPTSSVNESTAAEHTKESMSGKDAEHAEMLLRAAKRLIESGKTKTATMQLQAIVRRYPTSGVASEALSLLARLEKK